MTASKARKPKTPKTWRQKLQPYNTGIIALGLFTDALVTIFTVYGETPPFDPVIYGMLSATVKAANVSIHYVIKSIREEDSTDVAA
ncbi:hypothetical protein AB4P95_29780 (plasmid) [Pseudomonas sp. A1437]|uniref:hypothetical protein n=1 Tax=Pseudomonas sp. A1437 TaxID=3235107 RepID=UPI003783560D